MASYKSKKMMIDDVEFEVFALGAWEGQALLVRLAALLGPGIAVAMQGDAAFIAQLCINLPPKDIKEISSKLAENTMINMGSGVSKLESSFDLVFSGRYELMMKWLAFALEVNYGSFLGGIPGIYEFAKKLNQSPA